MKITRPLFLGALLVACRFCADAAIVTFTFGSSENLQSTFSKTVGGVTMTASDPNSLDGKFVADSDGLLLTDDPNSGPNSFQFSFSSAVQMISYTIGFVNDPTSGSFTLSRTGQTSSLNDIGTMGTIAINGLFNPGANETVLLTSNLSGSPAMSQIKSFTVQTVPEPSETVAFVGMTCGIGALMFRSRRPCH